MFSIKADFDRADRILSDIGRKQLPFATALALNDTAQDVKLREERQIEKDFDSPTPFTKRGLYLRRASKARLAAQVGFKPVQAEYLRLQVTGGVRSPKRKALVVPAGIRLNKYGNMPRGTVARLAARKDVFVAGRGRGATSHLPPGLYQRPKGKAGRAKPMKMLVAFEPRATYTKRHDFQGTALRLARRQFSQHWARRLKQAIATAR